MQEGENVNFPIAHGDGRYWIDAEGLARLQKNRQILFTYAQNPNGSTADIAGICNEEGNVFGLMPHPERATELRSQDGKKLWASVAKAVQGIRR
jgi:phosphoribosylformylglycinamidine synthase